MAERVVHFIVGFHQVPERVQDLAGRGWTVYNAPRPLMGAETWTGEFRHGVFYAAVPPDGDLADEFGDAPVWRERNHGLDGWPCEIVPMATICAYWEAKVKEYPEIASLWPWPDAYEQIVESWYDSFQEG